MFSIVTSAIGGAVFGIPGSIVGVVAGGLIDSLFAGGPKAIDLSKYHTEFKELQEEVATLDREWTKERERHSERMQELRSLYMKLELQLKGREEKMKDLMRLLTGIMERPSQVDISRTMTKLNFIDNHFHIAVAGCSGTGKSSFINAFRGMKNSDPEAAKTGYTETTTEVTQYRPRCKEDKIVWYDIPGAGTLTIPRWDYFKQQGLYVMNAVIILWCDRLVDTDVAILENCVLLKIPCFLVRSKCDIHLNNIRKDLIDDVEIAGGCKRADGLEIKFDMAVKTFIQATTECAEGLVRKAFGKADVAPQLVETPSWVFLVNKTSLYGMITEKRSDENTLDEEQLIISLGKAIASFQVV